jgi:hypothetical protein
MEKEKGGKRSYAMGACHEKAREKQGRVKQYDKRKEGYGEPSAIRKTGWEKA